MTADPFTVTYRAHCAWCRWDGPIRATEPDAEDDTLDHADTGQHRRNVERHQD